MSIAKSTASSIVSKENLFDLGVFLSPKQRISNNPTSLELFGQSQVIAEIKRNIIALLAWSFLIVIFVALRLLRMTKSVVN
ncbi:MAG TPA: hypothetical protein DCM70_09170 [Rhodobacteraceae bacterium]|jgi:hypothetical protein|nr:hypothetical protein [Paracoccaceae bacterium]